MDRPRVVILGDDPLARSGLAALLATTDEVTVIGEAALDRVDDLAHASVDVALVDLGAPGAERSGDPGATFPSVALVGDEPQAAAALASGARGVLLRSASADRLASALVAVHRGLLAVDPALARWLRPPPASGSEVEAGLTPRETQVLALLSEGLSNKGIAQRLGIAERTAKFHVESILSKLGAETRSEAIVLAARRGLVTL